MPRRVAGGSTFRVTGEVDGRDLISVEYSQKSPDVIGVGIIDDDAIQSLDAPAPQEIHDVRSLLRLSGVHEVVLATRLHEDRISLPHVYKAYD